ncbi:glycine-rich rna binding protein [Fusarium phyllophilum]|uniref:Glycine-rich rna binding protein n=1 Tax=Fusarium phyllophilum TaxID=47803 RepID=A0A8H5IB29_9HYPO|nr:glycine-rich rna binding protein [Fusarium phyllophilum]
MLQLFKRSLIFGPIADRLSFVLAAWTYVYSILGYVFLLHTKNWATLDTQSSPCQNPDTLESTKLHVDNISWHTTEDTLREVFGEYGEVTDTTVMRDVDTGRSRHFGFVTFETYKEACLARDSLNNQEVDGRRLKVREAPIRIQGSGEIVMRDRDTGRSQGFGFVTYSNPNEAESAIGAMNEQEIDGNHVKVNLANARVTGGGGGGYQGGYGGGYQQRGRYGDGGYPQGGYVEGY